jgi:hypothetical protein
MINNDQLIHEVALGPRSGWSDVCGRRRCSNPKSATHSGAGPGQVDPGHPRGNEVNAREQNQQHRIAHGENLGTMTPGQAARVENREQPMENQEKADLAFTMAT